MFPPLLLTLSDDEGVDIDDQPLINENQRRMQLLVVDNELEYNESMITQREDEIREIEQGINELNEIFRDLGTMVHEQGSMLGMSDLKKKKKVCSCSISWVFSLS
jgi:syntaxin 7